MGHFVRQMGNNGASGMLPLHWETASRGKWIYLTREPKGGEEWNHEKDVNL